VTLGTPVDRGAEIARTLAEAYRSEGAQPAPWRSGSALLAEVVPIIAIYTQTTNVHTNEIVSTDKLALVLTAETAVVAGEPKTWSGIHVWRFEAGHLARFEAYNQSLAVMPQRTVAAD
jgi:hypothetical protein